MEDKEAIKTKIVALSLKTVANGATASEEAMAKKMIARLLEKMGELSVKPQPNTVRQTEQPSKGYFEYFSLYQKHKKEGTLKKHAADIDWDILAKHMLTDKYDYEQYLYDTHTYWEKFNLTNKRLTKIGSPLAMNQDEYRMKCYEKFKAIYEERK